VRIRGKTPWGPSSSSDRGRRVKGPLEGWIKEALASDEAEGGHYSRLPDPLWFDTKGNGSFRRKSKGTIRSLEKGIRQKKKKKHSQTGGLEGRKKLNSSSGTAGV